MELDLILFNLIHSASGVFKLLDWVGIFAAAYLPYFMLVGFILLVLRQSVFSQKFYFFILAFLSALLSRGIITETIRFFYDRSRPFEALDFTSLINHSASGSFPSGHASFYFVIVAVVYFLDRRWFRYFFPAAILIGMARVFVGVHWPLDVAAGAIIAISSVFVVRYFLPKGTP